MQMAACTGGGLHEREPVEQVTYNRLKATLQLLSQAPARAAAAGAPLTEVLFGARPPRFSDATRCCTLLCSASCADFDNVH